MPKFTLYTAIRLPTKGPMPITAQFRHVTLPPKLPTPSGAMVVLYGRNDALAALQEMRIAAESEKLLFIPVRIFMTVNQMKSGQLSSDDLRVCEFIDLERLNVKAAEKFLEAMRAFPAVPGLEFPDRFREVGRRMDLVAEVILAHFAQVRVCVLRIPYKSNSRKPEKASLRKSRESSSKDSKKEKWRKVALLFTTEGAEIEQPASREIEVVFPRSIVPWDIAEEGA